MPQALDLVLEVDSAECRSDLAVFLLRVCRFPKTESCSVSRRSAPGTPSLTFLGSADVRQSSVADRPCPQ
jgi:hypothetical protein